MEEVDNEEELVVGERLDLGPKDCEPKDRWAITRKLVTKRKRKNLFNF